MSNTQTTTLEGRKLLPHEIAYADQMANLLAKESGIDVIWIKEILIKTFPDSGINIREVGRFERRKGEPEISFRSTRVYPYPGTYLYEFKPCLLEAMKWFDKDYVVELFSGDLRQLKILEERYNSLVNEIPFVSFRDILPTAKEFQTYLEEEFETIISTGDIPGNRHFKNSPYLEKTFLQSFRYRASDAHETPKEIYFKRHEQFIDGLLSPSFLEELLGSEYYREYGEIVTIDDFLNPNHRDMKNRLKAALQGLITKIPTSISRLEWYLAENKLKVPPGLKKRDELLRTSLHKFSQDTLNAFIMTHRNHEQGSILKKVWELIGSMPYDQLDLIFNGNLSYFGFVEYDIDNPNLYTYGRERIEKILLAAAIEDRSIQSNCITKIREDLQGIIEDFIDPKTGELHPITYSVYQAIDLCGYEVVISACGELAKAKDELSGLKATIEQKTKKALEISYRQLIELRRSLTELGEKKTKRPDEPGFSENYEEYKSKNSNYGTFVFSSPKKRTAIELLDSAYQSGDPRVSITDLITQLYASELTDVASDSSGRKKERTRKEVLDNKTNWRLDRDIFAIEEPVVKYRMIQRGLPKNGERTYVLDFSFEQKDPEALLQDLQSKKDKKSQEAPKAKSKTPSEKQAQKKSHPWSHQGRSSKAKVYTNKGGTLYDGEEEDSDD